MLLILASLPVALEAYVRCDSRTFLRYGRAWRSVNQTGYEASHCFARFESRYPIQDEMTMYRASYYLYLILRHS